jgi:hypothetical protein
MKFREKNHITELFFSLALLCVFLITGVLVILTGAGVYRDTVRSSEVNYGTRTALSYIAEKVRQNDRNGSISLGATDDGVPALLIGSEYQETPYVTYIYASGGELRELFVRQDAPADSSGGTSLLETASLSFEELDGGLLRITAADGEGNASSLLLHPSSQPESGKGGGR